MLKRIKRLWKLSKKDPKALDALTGKDIEKLPNVGNGKGVFISEGTEKDYDDMIKEEKGFKGIFGL